MDQMQPRRKMRLTLLHAIAGFGVAAALVAPAKAQTSNAPENNAAAGPLLRGTDGVPVAPDAAFVDAAPSTSASQQPAAPVVRVDENGLPVQPAEPVQGRALPAAAAPPVTGPDGNVRANVRTAPVEAGVLRTDPDDPFARTGLRMGIWDVFARIEQGIGYATNNSFTTGGQPGWFSQTNAELEMRSDWSRHEASIIALGELRRSIGTDDSDIPDVSVEGNLRLDLIDGYSANFNANYAYSTEELTSESLSSSAIDRPAVNEYGGSVELARTGGLMEMTLRGSVDRSTYGTERLADGTTQSQDDRNSTLYELASIVAYGPTPALKPFIHTGVGWRVFDDTVDRNGDNRNSFLYDLRAGLRLDFGDKLNGEIAVGYASEDFDGARLATKDAVTVNGAINWSPERDTIVTFLATTGFGGSTTPGDNGSVDYAFGLEAERRVRHNLATTATASYATSRFDTTGTSDETYTVGAGIEYWVSRYLSLTADVEYQRYNGIIASDNWDSASVRVGVALQN